MTPSTQRIRVAVSGLAGTFPFGGVFWDYLQYVLGLHRMGHDVLYVEDTQQWCYDPVAQTYIAGAATNAAALARHLAALDPALADRWYLRDAEDRTYGRTPEAAAGFCRSADLFINVSGTCFMRDEYFAARRTAYIDSDPLYTQASVPGYIAGTATDDERRRVEQLRRHDVFFTFGENIRAPDCRMPRDLFDWRPTRQPIVLDCFAPHRLPPAARRPVLTTVASWEPKEQGPTVGGVSYKGKSAEWPRFLDLPSRSPVAMQVALSGPAPRDAMRSRGWRVIEGLEATRDPWAYRDYLRTSLAEWSVAKNAYVDSRSGWFSCRSACYLALGVPTIVQDTGFTNVLPTGAGIVPFSTPDEAADAIARVTADIDRHSRAAIELATEHFDAHRVLGLLIDEALTD